MKYLRSVLSGLLAATACSATCAIAAEAQTQYPTRPVRMVVGFAAGGATDLFARIVAQRLTERWGQQVVVDNRTGAGGSLGTAIVAKAQPDGYTLAVISSSHMINASLYKSLPFDAVADFEGVAMICGITNVLAVNPALPAKSVAEFIALAKAKPGTINFASGGVGSSSHLGGELFKSAAGIQIVHVPYKGTADALRDLISGQVQSTVMRCPRCYPISTKARCARSASATANACRSCPTSRRSRKPGYPALSTRRSSASLHLPARRAKSWRR